MVNETDYAELGLACANVCRALDRGMSGKRVDELSQSVLEAIEQLTAWVQSVVNVPGILLNDRPIVGLWPTSRRILLGGKNGVFYLGIFTRRMTKS